MKEAEIDHLKEKVNSFEDIVDLMKSEHRGSSCDCNLCEYKCNSEKALKNHETRKHRQEILRKMKILMNICNRLLNTVIGSMMFPMIHVKNHTVHSLYRRRQTHSILPQKWSSLNSFLCQLFIISSVISAIKNTTSKHV